MNKQTNLIAFKRFARLILDDLDVQAIIDALDVQTIIDAQAHARFLIDARAKAGKLTSEKLIKSDDPKAVANRERVRKYRARSK